MSPNLQVNIQPLGIDLTNIVSCNFTRGRRTKSEPYSAASFTIEVQNPSQLANVQLEMSANLETVDPYWGTINLGTGYVTNIQYNYGKLTAMDTATISLEGYLAFIGRGQLQNYTLTGGTTGYEATQMANYLTGTGKTIGGSGTSSLTSAANYTGSALNLLTTLVATEQGRLDEGYDQLYFWGRDYLFPRPDEVLEWAQYLVFTDTNPATTGIEYDQLIFSSLSDNYFTQARVEPSGLAVQSAGTGSRNLVVSTYDATESQAADLAKYVLGEFDSNVSVPVTVRTKSSLQWKLNPAKVVDNAIGLKVQVVFRGNTYNAVVEGCDVAYTPEESVYYFHLSGFEQNNYFLLGDDAFGLLDYNQLSF